MLRPKQQRQKWNGRKFVWVTPSDMPSVVEAAPVVAAQTGGTVMPSSIPKPPREDRKQLCRDLMKSL